MKLTKTAIAVAIVGIAAAPMMVSADTTLSGIMEIQVQGTDADDVAATTDFAEGDPEVAVGDILFNIATNHELNSGLTGYGNMRADFNSRSNEGAAQADSVYIGIKGGFGDFRMGEIPLAVEYGQVANDIFDVGAEINGGLSYTGTFGPVGLTANFSPENNSDVIGLGGKFSIGGFGIGVGFEDRADAVNMSAGVSFAFAGASIAANFWSQEMDNDDMESVTVKVGYGFGGVSAAVTIAAVERGNLRDEEAIRLDLAYGLGGGMAVSTRITAASDNNNSANDLTSWRIQLNKAF